MRAVLPTYDVPVMWPRFALQVHGSTGVQDRAQGQDTKSGDVSEGVEATRSYCAVRVVFKSIEWLSRITRKYQCCTILILLVWCTFCSMFAFECSAEEACLTYRFFFCAVVSKYGRVQNSTTTAHKRCSCHPCIQTHAYCMSSEYVFSLLSKIHFLGDGSMKRKVVVVLAVVVVRVAECRTKKYPELS